MTREVKYSGVEWIGEIPREWLVSKFKYISKLYTGVSIKDADKDNYLEKENSLTYVATKDINSTSHSIDYSNVLYTKKGDEKFRVAPKNSTLMCIEGGSAGKKKTLLDSDVTFGNKLCCFYPKDIEHRYLNYFLSSSEYEKHFFNQMTGLIGGVSVSRLKNFPIVFPNYNEQKLIADILDIKTQRINQLILSTEQSVEELKKYKQSLITEAVTKGLDPHVEMKDSSVEWIGNTPELWMVIKLNQLFSIKKNIANETGYDVLSVTQRGLRVRDITKNAGQMAADYSKYQIVEKDDFVMNHMDLLTGWVDIAKQQGVTSPDYRVFYNKQKEIVLNEYYLYIFQTAYTNKIFYGLGQGVSNVGRWRLQTDKFVNFYVPLPNLKEQKQIVSYLDEKTSKIDKLIEDKTKVIEELENYKKSLIYEYVTGKKEA